MVANYVNKIGVQNIDGTYSYQDIGTDSDHIEVDATGKKLSAKLTELENATPDIATSSTPGIVKPGTGMEVDDTGALNLTYDHTLTFTKEGGTVIDTYDGSTDKTISVATIPTDHSSVNTTYGVATTGKYGHVKVVDTYQTEPGATNGTVASATALHEAYKELKAGTGIHKTQVEYDALSESEKKNGSTYYVDDGKDGTLTSDNVAYDNSVSGLSAEYVKTAIDELAVRSAKPTAHPSSVATTYGAGTGSEFGHVRLSDSYKASDGNADASVAASSYALYQAYNELNGNLIFNNIYKHRDLGTITSSNRDEWIAKHINSDGTFNDIYVGDIVTIQDGVYNAKWVVAGFDTEFNKGDTALTTHHISLIPATYLFTAPMNDTDTTTGGYAGSKMHTSTLVTVANNLKNALGSHLLERRVLLSNSMSTSIASGAGAGYTGASNGWNWCSAFCTLLTEVQVYGSRVFSSSFYDIGEGCSQLPLFKFVNHVYYGRFDFWLRAVASSTGFAIANGHGDVACNSASYAYTVRPLITIG